MVLDYKILEFEKVDCALSVWITKPTELDSVSLTMDARAEETIIPYCIEAIHLIIDRNKKQILKTVSWESLARTLHT